MHDEKLQSPGGRTTLLPAPLPGLRERHCGRDGRESLPLWKALCWGGELIFHPGQPGPDPKFQGVAETGSSSSSFLIEHQLKSGSGPSEQRCLCG